MKQPDSSCSWLVGASFSRVTGQGHRSLIWWACHPEDSGSHMPTHLHHLATHTLTSAQPWFYPPFHQIKAVDVAKKTCVSVAGKGTPGYAGGRLTEAQFSEPGGLCLPSTGDVVYVADTNNHRIRTLDLATETVADVSAPPGESPDEHLADVSSIASLAS